MYSLCQDETGALVQRKLGFLFGAVLLGSVNGLDQSYSVRSTILSRGKNINNWDSYGTIGEYTVSSLTGLNFTKINL